MTKLAMRATRALQKENGRRLLAREEFLTQDEIAELIDKEALIPELTAALQAMLAHTEPNYGVTSQQSVWNVARRVLAEANNPEVSK